MTALLTSAFILGIISNLHCIGMCGPIAMAIPLDRSSKVNLLSGILQYNGGRILTYAILGSIVGIIGFGINLIGILQSMSIIAGIAIILYAWRKYLFNGKIFRAINTNFLQKFTSKYMGKIIRKQSPFKLGLLGMLNGLLPCGMVYTGLITSLIAENPFQSGLTMIFFGLGTLPGMIAFSLFAHQMQNRYRTKINAALPYLVSIIGLLIVLRGMNLDIPYISPKAKFSQETKKVEMSCCHGKQREVGCSK